MLNTIVVVPFVALGFLTGVAGLSLLVIPTRTGRMMKAGDAQGGIWGGILDAIPNIIAAVGNLIEKIGGLSEPAQRRAWGAVLVIMALVALGVAFVVQSQTPFS
jgi:hypothetical protein